YSRRTSHSYVLQIPRRRRCPLFPYTTLFRSCGEFDDPTVGLPSGRWEMRCAGFDGTQLAGGTTAQLQWGSACTISVRWDTNKDRSEEHTSELQSRENLVCRLLLEKKNMIRYT